MFKVYLLWMRKLELKSGIIPFLGTIVINSDDSECWISMLTPSTAQANAAFYPSAPVIGPSGQGDVVVFGSGSTIFLLEAQTGSLLGTKFLPLYYTGTQTVLTPLWPLPTNPMVLWRDATASPFVGRLYTLLSSPTNQTGVYNTVLGGT